jgi:hypothetical protein
VSLRGIKNTSQRGNKLQCQPCIIKEPTFSWQQTRLIEFAAAYQRAKTKRMTYNDVILTQRMAKYSNCFAALLSIIIYIYMYTFNYEKAF